ncbi:hypothetical protein ACFL0Z_01155 [Patescibacteria group bacterium]
MVAEYTTNSDVKPSKIDPKITAVLGGEEVTDQVLAIADEMDFANTQVAKFSESILFLFQKKISLENYPYVLQNELGINEAEALKAATYVGKMFIVPHAYDFFPDGEEYFKKWLQEAKTKGVDFSRRSQVSKSTSPTELTTASASESVPVSVKEEMEAPADQETSISKPVAGVAASPKSSTLSTTADIRPVKRSVTTSTPAKPAAAAPAVLKLTSVAALENISPRALDQEPPDPGKLTDRLKQEIQNIANASGAKRSDIIAAWKKSQLYHAYIDMGNDSMQQGKSIPEVTALRKAEGKPYLTESQFHAISDVSRLLLS